MGFIFNYTFKDNAYAEFSQNGVKFWAGEGLPAYEGSMEGWVTEYPEYVKVLVKAKILTEVK